MIKDTSALLKDLRISNLPNLEQAVQIQDAMDK